MPSRSSIRSIGFLVCRERKKEINSQILRNLGLGWNFIRQLDGKAFSRFKTNGENSWTRFSPNNSSPKKWTTTPSNCFKLERKPSNFKCCVANFFFFFSFSFMHLNFWILIFMCIFFMYNDYYGSITTRKMPLATIILTTIEKSLLDCVFNI